MGGTISPDEVIEKIKETYGLSVSRSTLLNYTKNGLIPTPERKYLGRGGGCIAEYPSNTHEVFFSAMVRNARIKDIKKDR